MKKLILWLLLIIPILSITSQTTYPKEVILGKDSLICLTYNQIRTINTDLEAFQGCKSELLASEKLILIYDTLVQDGTKLVQNLNLQIIEFNGIVDNQKKIIDFQDKQYKSLQKKKKTGEIILWTGVSIGIMSTIGVLIWGATK